MRHNKLELKHPGSFMEARQSCRKLARELGFSTADQTRLVTAVSEITRNVIVYAGEGVYTVADDSTENANIIRVIIEDFGSGIVDVDKALEPGFTTSGGLGMGLPSAKQLVHDFSINSQPGHTIVKLKMIKPHKKVELKQYTGEGVCTVTDKSDKEPSVIHMMVEDHGSGIDDVDKTLDPGVTNVPLKMIEPHKKVELKHHNDIMAARQSCRELARELGFGTADQVRLITAVSELTRNVIQYAGEGTCIVTDKSDKDYFIIRVVVEDHGPGIADVGKALEPGFTTGDSLGMGLTGARRLVHDFSINSQPGHTAIQLQIIRKKT